MINRLRPSLRALLIHVLSCFLVLAYRFFIADQDNPPPLLYLTIAQGILATIIGIVTGLRAWWIPINLLFFPLLLAVLNQSINPLWYLFGFILIWLLNWNAFGEQVPLYLSGQKTITALAHQLDKDKTFVMADFGCGIASVLVKTAKEFPQAQFVGYETAPLTYLIAKIRSIGISNLTIKRSSFWTTDWSQYDVIYCFLSPAPMPAIGEDIENRIKPGARLISNSFPLPEKEFLTKIPVDDLRGTLLYIYQY